MELDFDEKYQAVVARNPEYEGLFFTAVKTTGIFCRPTCRARKPLRKNVEFFSTAKEAILHGYRPCLTCRPLESLGSIPPPVKRLLDVIDKDPFKKLTDADLRKLDLEPTRVRRWFKQHHQLTFHAYQRMLRINSSLKDMITGKKVTHTAFDTGYQSLSGFHEQFRKVVGPAPSKAKHMNVITVTRLTTPLGPMIAGATTSGICLLEFSDRRMLESEFHDLKKRLKAVILPGTNGHLRQLSVELEQYFKNANSLFEVELDAPGSEFQQRVWKALRNIRPGETRSYQSLAEEIGCANSVRAVANANGANRIAIIIPCHRVIGKNGNLTGYGGGLARKQWLLDWEKQSAIEKFRKSIAQTASTH